MKIFRSIGLLIFFSANANAAALLNENFDNISTLPGSGWVLTNNSSPTGTTNWFQGNTGVFASQGGVDDSYIAANFLNTELGGNISNWLLTPNLTVNNGDELTFYTRSAGNFPDRLEVRFSSSGTSTDVGTSDLSVGDFTHLLLTINPTLANNSFPSDWTLETITFSGLGSPVSGRIGFRYFVTDTNSNGDYIGIDTLIVSSFDQGTVPEPGTLSCLGIGLIYLLRRHPSLAMQSKQV